MGELSKETAEFRSRADRLSRPRRRQWHREWRATARLANPVERDAQIKRALGIGEDTFTRLA